MKKRKYIFLIAAIIVVVVAIMSVYRNLINLKIHTGSESKSFYIPTGSSYDDVISALDTTFDIKKPGLFNWIAIRKNYDSNIRPGKYEVQSGTSYFELIDMLRAGNQKPVKVIFNNVRTLNQLAGKVGGRIEADSISIISFLNDESNYSEDGFTRETIIGVFIPDTYEFFWNTDAEGFYKRMLREYKNFWNPDRLKRAEKIKLDPNGVSTLASIVDDEVAKKDEKPRIAGVYLNRLKIGMPLQACPTIRFALNDYTITRVLNKHLTVESPYNTYKYRGLPPGPVGCPSIEGIEAVLNAEEHDYLFFAAKPDFSGYHNFSRTLSEHNRYAASYQNELNRRRIFK